MWGKVRRREPFLFLEKVDQEVEQAKSKRESPFYFPTLTNDFIVVDRREGKEGLGRVFFE